MPTSPAPAGAGAAGDRTGTAGRPKRPPRQWNGQDPVVPPLDEAIQALWYRTGERLGFFDSDDQPPPTEGDEPPPGPRDDDPTPARL
jgi:hypothetical protein